MKAYNELVFDQTVKTGNGVTSASSVAEQMGRADSHTFEIEVNDSSSATLTVNYAHSNSGVAFTALAAPLLNQAITPPFRTMVTVVGPLGALGQLQVAVSGASAWAKVRIWDCGRMS